jgi:hypothetical protein
MHVFLNVTFWRSADERLPGLSRLAQMYTFAVATSTDAERSFSKYNKLYSHHSVRSGCRNIAYAGVFVLEFERLGLSLARGTFVHFLMLKFAFI